ncbi:MAG: glycoside hydrolase family 88 protein [Bacteroidetes bacterium]|nr:glycoside hydrolase family 88 protein [Bacteroidota bacterium]
MKNKTNLLVIIALVIMLNALSVKSYAKDYTGIIEKIELQLLKKVKIFDGRWPEFTVDGIWKYRENVNWFSGFAAGELFLMNEITSNKILFDEAIVISDVLINYADINYTHDMGFIFLHSAINAYRKTGDVKYKEAGLRAAKMLAKRFNEKGNFIRAWGELGSDDREGLMIIDTMLNLELLFWAAREYGIPEFYDIAYKHAVVCLNEHLRDNFSSYHVVEFDPDNGKILKKYTHQGFTDNSTWARGQAWGIYGFAQVYKNTGDIRFLNASKKMADFFLNQLPDDNVPYWDLDISDVNVSKDASAGAIAASGMSILAEVCNTKEDYKKYISAADIITESLVENYTFLNSNRKIEEGILIHTVYNFNAGWGIDESFPCGDYYFVEALHKYLKRNLIDINTDVKKKD